MQKNQCMHILEGMKRNSCIKNEDIWCRTGSVGETQQNCRHPTPIPFPCYAKTPSTGSQTRTWMFISLFAERWNSSEITRWEGRNDLYCHFLPSAIEVCGEKVDQWREKVGAYHCLVVAIRLVSGFCPASAIDQVLYWTKSNLLVILITSEFQNLNIALKVYASVKINKVPRTLRWMRFLSEEHDNCFVPLKKYEYIILEHFILFFYMNIFI